MKRNKGIIWVLTFLPSLTLLGSLVLMNDDNDASRRGMLSIFLLLLSVGQMLVYSFFIGYLPGTNSLALRTGAIYFALFIILFILRMADRYAIWFPLMATDQVPRMRIILSVIGGVASVGLFLLGYAVRYRKRKRREDGYENDAFR